MFVDTPLKCINFKTLPVVLLICHNIANISVLCKLSVNSFSGLKTNLVT